MTTHNAKTIQALLDAATPGAIETNVYKHYSGTYNLSIEGFATRESLLNYLKLIAAASSIAQLYLDQCKVVEKLVDALEPFAKVGRLPHMKRNASKDAGLWSYQESINGDTRIMAVDAINAAEALAAVRKDE